jgi:hypothetical protein
VAPDGTERGRFPQQPGTGENGSSVPFDSPSSARFLGTRLIVAQQSFFAGDPAHQAIMDVEAGEPGLPELIPPGAGLSDALPPRITRVRIDGRRLRLRVSEPADIVVRATSRGGRRYHNLRAGTLPRGGHSFEFKLEPGRWRVAITARDLAGNRSRPVRRTVRVR